MSNIHQICRENSTRIEFLKRINKTESCWEWTGTIISHGYGHFKRKGKLYRAHRVSYVIFKGPIPNGLLVCHTCDSRKCVNPDHLFLGTHMDNMDDMTKKGRGVGNKLNHHSGDDHHGTKVTSKMVTEIKLLSSRYSQRKLAKIFGVAQGSIWNAIHKR